MTKHTPAPWAVEQDHDDDPVDTWMIHGAADQPGLTPVALVYTADAFPCVDDEDRAAFEAECVANATLIAVAPELLEMLETPCDGLAWNIENHPDIMTESDSEALVAARALIAKARPAEEDRPAKDDITKAEASILFPDTPFDEVIEARS
jgi:hypothetical protein